MEDKEDCFTGNLSSEQLIELNACTLNELTACDFALCRTLRDREMLDSVGQVDRKTTPSLQV